MTDDDDTVDKLLARLGLAASELPPEVLRVVADHLLADQPEAPADMSAIMRASRGPSPESSNPEPTDPAALDVLKLEAARRTGLPLELAGDLRGTTPGELTEHAERLVGAIASMEPRPPTTSVPSGPRGTNIEPTAAQAFNDAVRRAAGQPPATF